MAGTVPELLAKKRKRDEQWAAQRAAAAAEAKQKNKKTRSEIFKRAEKYVQEYRKQVRRLATGTAGKGSVVGAASPLVPLLPPELVI